MKPILFTVPIVPKAQKRARACSRGRFASVYKDASQRDYEETIYAHLSDYQPEMPIDEPICVTIIAYLPIPKSMSKKKTKQAQEGDLPHMKTPDVDNLLKNILDCMTKMEFWIDDKIIQEATVQKRYTDEGKARWAVLIRPWDMSAKDMLDETLSKLSALA